MRRLPEERSGTQTAMRLAAGNGARAAAGSVGAKTNRRGRMPTIARDGGSEALLEEFHAFRVFGFPDANAMPARLVDAICVLEQQLRWEQSGEPEIR